MGFLINGSYPYIQGLDIPDVISPISSLSEPKPPWAFKINSSIMDGYPYIFEYIKPLEPPERGTASVNTGLGLVGKCVDLNVTFQNLSNTVSGDEFVVDILSGSSVLISKSVVLTQQLYQSLSVTVEKEALSALSVGDYTVRAYILRSETEYCIYSFPYTISVLPSLSIKNIVPQQISKPIPDGSAVAVTYEISGAGLKKVDNSFTLAGLTASQSLSSSELLVVEASTRSSNLYDASFNFTVTDPAFKLISFKFLFGTYNANTQVDYRLDGTTVQIGNYPMGDWVEYVAPAPIPLAVGSHTIRLYNQPSYWYLFTTSVKPQVKGMTITSSTLYAMQMVYTLSSSGIGGERTVTIGLDDSLELGLYDLTVNSDAVIDGYGTYSFEITKTNALGIIEAVIPDPTMSGLTLSKIGRYVGCETNITVALLSFSDILWGDTLTVWLKKGETIIYSNKSSLSDGQNSFSHNIPAAVFIGLEAGTYTVTVTLERGQYSTELQSTYTVVPSPTVTFQSISPDVIQLPISTPVNISCVIRVSGINFNLTQGSVGIGSTALSSSINRTNSNSAAYQDISAEFLNINSMAADYYNVNYSLTVTSNEYGAFLCQGQVPQALQVLAPIPEAQIGGVSLDYEGRYYGCEVPVTVTASLVNIIKGDGLKVQLYTGSTVYYTHSDVLSGGETSYNFIIPQDTFDGLSVGLYTVWVSVERHSKVVYSEVSFKVVKPPEAILLSVNPDKIQLPISPSFPLKVTFEALGDEVNDLTGSVSIIETAYSCNINSISRTFDASFNLTSDIEPKGYGFSILLSVQSHIYGTVILEASFDNAFRVLAPLFIPKNSHTGILYIYKDFELVAILRNYISLKWIRRYNKVGEFLLQLEKTPENVALIRSGNIISKDGDDEAGFIEDISINDKIEVKGAFISKMLTFRILSFASESPVDLKSTANQLITENFISAVPSRIIPDFRIEEYTIRSQNLMANIQNNSIVSWLENQDVGFKVKFNTVENKFDFLLYDGKQSSAVFCDSFKNITDQQLFDQTASSKNVCYVEANDQRFEVGYAQGLNRREAYVRAGNYAPVEYGNLFLKQNKPLKSLDVKIVSHESPFIYKVDYDVGDIVKIISEEYRVELTKNILEITEFWDCSGFHLYIIFGDIPRDILTELKDKDNRLEALEKEPYPISKDELKEEIETDLDEKLKSDLELLIPDIVDEVFKKIEFPPLPDYLSQTELNKRITDIVDEKLRTFNPGGGNSDSTHIILDHLPVQTEIDTMALNAIVLVYNKDSPFTPVS